MSTTDEEINGRWPENSREYFDFAEKNILALWDFVGFYCYE